MTRFMLALLLLTSPVLAQSNEVKPGTAQPQMQTSAWIRPAIQGEERDDEGAALAPPTPGEIRAALRAAEEAQAADGEGAELPPVTLGLEGLAEALWDEDPEADGAGLMGDERFEDLFSEEEGDEA